MRLPRLPASPVENSLEARAFVFSGFCVAVLAIVLYGQDYIVPAAGVAATAIGHVISYRGRLRKRNDALFHSLLKAGLSFREIARIAKCSHGSVSASKKEYLAKVELETSQKQVESATKFDGIQEFQAPVALLESSVESDAIVAAAKDVGEQTNG